MLRTPRATMWAPPPSPGTDPAPPSSRAADSGSRTTSDVGEGFQLRDELVVGQGVAWRLVERSGIGQRRRVSSSPAEATQREVGRDGHGIDRSLVAHEQMRLSPRHAPDPQDPLLVTVRRHRSRGVESNPAADARSPKAGSARDTPLARSRIFIGPDPRSLRRAVLRARGPFAHPERAPSWPCILVRSRIRGFVLAALQIPPADPAIAGRVQCRLVGEGEVLNSPLVPCLRGRAFRQVEEPQLAGLQIPHPKGLRPLAIKKRGGDPPPAR